VKLWEHHTDPLASHRVFLGRLGRQLVLAGMIVIGALAAGVAGYMTIGRLDFVDAFLEASMFLSGAGPLYTERDSSNEMKLFSSIYALFSTLIVVVAVGFLASPVVHRILHRLHMDRSR
jgi:hypothetical protein